MLIMLIKIYVGSELLLFALESITRLALHNAEVKYKAKQLKEEGKGAKLKRIWTHYALVLNIKDNFVKLWSVMDHLL